MTIDRATVKKWGHECGFELVGIAQAGPVPDLHAEALGNYLSRGFAGNMVYMSRNLEKRIDVTRLVSGATAVICVALSYFYAEQISPAFVPAGRISRYARRTDYHEVLKNKLRRLINRLKDKTDSKYNFRAFVDTAPLLEKYYAAQAGLGWIGKNGLLINQQYGSWLVLGEIVTDLPLENDLPAESLCGNCRKCLDVCPAKALVQPRILNASRCISYQTIENPAPIPEDFETLISDRVFGCDICQEVCPHNQGPRESSTPEFQTNPELAFVILDEIERLTPKQFDRKYQNTPIHRLGLDKLKRNAQICLRNVKDPGKTEKPPR